ncbi:hypothetical protein GCM10008995_29060 [Halobellus salinus]|uniref:HTH domain-containing protein n=1 Tax=Halobellus salinus TaxID=931585 RepID=A0A830EEC8_9EURY|nr:hypothetical protein [Halobellus salinus]GGJ17427.1 hypothetical protein GCM10008995_29060 [Halobellus salinus]SMP35503.1 hypothetical protein SAMN06265347_1313 [Halobellus salinus]
MPREHGKDGEFVETVSLENVLDVFDAVDGPVILSADVADTLGCSRETARRKLNDLYDRGDLDRRKVSRRVIYWIPEDPTPDTVGRTQEARDTREADAGEDPTPDRENPVEDGAESDPVEDVRAYLERENVGPKTAHGRDAVIEVVRLLRDRGPMKTGELQAELFDRFGEHYSSERSLWESIRRAFEDVPGIEDAGYGKYGYAGDADTREALGK